MIYRASQSEKVKEETKMDRKKDKWTEGGIETKTEFDMRDREAQREGNRLMEIKSNRHKKILSEKRTKKRERNRKKDETAT